MIHLIFLFLAVLLPGLAPAIRAEELPAPSLAQPAAPEEQATSKKDEPEQEAAKPEEKTESKPSAAAKKESKTQSAEDILTGRFQALKGSAEDRNSDFRSAALESLRVLAEQHPEAPEAPEALALLAKNEDYRPALVDLLHLAYEYPESSLAAKAKSDYLDLVNKKMSRKYRAGLGNLAKTPEAQDKAARLAELIYGLTENSADALVEPLAAELRRFQVRFPDFKDQDHVLWSRVQFQVNAERFEAALMSDRELLAYQASPFRERAQFNAGRLLSEKLKRYREAVDAFQAYLERYPKGVEVLDALQRLAVLYAERLQQAPLAVETYERIIKLFPKSDGALRAFNDEADLQRGRLKQPQEAIKTYLRLTEQFRYPQAAQALMDAAQVCRKDLKDYKREVELRSKVAADFPAVKEAPEQLFAAAEVTEDDLKDVDGAIKLYQDIAAKFPSTKQGKKAADRAAKLQQKKG